MFPNRVPSKPLEWFHWKVSLQWLVLTNQRFFKGGKWSSKAVQASIIQIHTIGPRKRIKGAAERVPDYWIYAVIEDKCSGNEICIKTFNMIFVREPELKQVQCNPWACDMWATVILTKSKWLMKRSSRCQGIVRRTKSITSCEHFETRITSSAL